MPDTTTTTEQTVDTNTEQQTDTGLSQENATKTEQTTSEEKATPQELKQREIISNKQKLIDDGTIKHSDLAPWLQERTTANANASPDNKESERDIIAKEIREDMEYEQAKKTIPADTSKEDLAKMETIMGDERYSAMSKTDRLEYAKFQVGIAENKAIADARKEGKEIGKFGLLGLGNHDANEAQDELSKTEAKYDTLPKFLQK